MGYNLELRKIKAGPLNRSRKYSSSSSSCCFYDAPAP